MKKIYFLILFILIILTFSKLISAVPELPMIVSGNVSINENPAKIGTEISAELNGKEIVKVKTTEKGKFSLLLQKLNKGDEVEIYVDNIYSGQKIVYTSSDFKQLDLKVEKSYILYYVIGGIIALAVILIIWKLKKK
ncbi:MAG: hypothetical protein Q7S33_01880 [Nanoarchaeota archaeon]|nr:hypothetical protein [Nanoarchaeota archaeon]